MNGYVEGPKTFTAGADVEAHRLLKLSSGDVVHNTATSTDDPVGVALSKVASGVGVASKLINGAGTLQIELAGTIATGAKVFAAADGKVQALPAAAATYRQIGIALEAGVEDEIIEILPYDFGNTEVVS